MKTLKLLCIVLLLFLSEVSYAQNVKIDKDNFKEKKSEKLNDTIRLFINNRIKVQGGLKIEMTSFSHKKTSGNQISPGISHLEISKNWTKSTPFTLRVSYYEDEQGNRIRSYSTEEWKNYKIKLIALDYDNFIDIVVSKGD